MKITLVLCPSWGIETPHLGIALLAAALRKQNHQVAVFDINIQIHHKYKTSGLWKSEEDIHWEDPIFVSKFIDENEDLLNSFVSQIISTGAQAIGFSIYFTTSRISLELARRIKAKDKDKIIIFGGQQCFPESSAECIIKDKSVDMVVIGEGDQTLPELINKLEASRDLDSCPGVIFKKDGRIVNCGMRLPIMDLDSLPFPDFSDFSLSSYDKPYQLPILSSRGCPYSCVFCNTKLFWIKFRSMSGERIFREMEYQLNRYKGIRFFTFNDHVIDANIPSLSHLCDLIIQEKSVQQETATDNWEDLTWYNLTWKGLALIRPELTYEFLKKMRQAGCIELEYGIESCSQRILDKMKKTFNIEVAERVIRDTQRAGISVRANFMFGFPGETEEDFQKTLDFLERNKDVFTEVHPSETFCHIDPGTYLINHLEEFDVSPHSLHSLYWESNDAKNTYPERLKRHQSFCQLATFLKIPLSPGGYKIMLYKDHFLNEFYRYKEANERKQDSQILVTENVPKSQGMENIKEEEKPDKIFRWILHDNCNYRCPYCLYYNQSQHLMQAKEQMTAEKWVKFWHRIYEKYGSVSIELTGGEPFIYPFFTELIKELLKEHTVKMKTNLSCSIEILTNFIKQINNLRKPKMSLVFHPLFTEFEPFINKALFLRDNGFTNEVFCFAYPPQMKQLNYYKNKFKQKDFVLLTLPFFGHYHGVDYPEGYAEQEKQILGDYLSEDNRRRYSWLFGNESKSCGDAEKYVLVKPDGDITICNNTQLAEINEDFFKEDISL